MKRAYWLATALVLTSVVPTIAGGFEFPSSDNETLLLGTVKSIDIPHKRITVSVQGYAGPNDGSTNNCFIFKSPRPKVLILDGHSQCYPIAGSDPINFKVLFKALKIGTHLEVMALNAPQGKPAVVKVLGIDPVTRYQQYLAALAHLPDTKTVSGK